MLTEPMPSPPVPTMSTTVRSKEQWGKGAVVTGKCMGFHVDRADAVAAGAHNVNHCAGRGRRCNGTSANTDSADKVLRAPSLVPAMPSTVQAEEQRSRGAALTEQMQQ